MTEPKTYADRLKGMVENEAQSDGISSLRQKIRTVALALVAVLALATALTWGLTQPDTPDDLVVAREQEVSADDSDEAPAEVRVRLEEVDGIFIEGFEIGLRFETGNGELIASTLWSDFVASTGRTDIDSFYDSVLHQSVPAGTVEVSAEVNVGIGPGPSIPDLSGELPCRLTFDVEPGAVATVQVRFDESIDCLELVPTSGGPDSVTPSPEMRAAPTTTTLPAVGSGTPDPDTPDADTPEPVSLEVGTTHYVDVDLHCRAFELAGVWVLLEGDTAKWQSPGERHEGGLFTIDQPGHGRFVGDAKGEKAATFRLLAPNEAVACRPVPRGHP